MSKTSFTFQLEARQRRARAGKFQTPHGELLTPVFAPVGTQASVKSLTPAHLADLNASLILANTYHLYLRPGDGLVAEMGGLHQFMQWPHPILTDSGGFQVFSLGGINQIDDEGVTFKSHVDGSMHRLTPEKSINIQENLGALGWELSLEDIETLRKEFPDQEHRIETAMDSYPPYSL